MDNAKILEYFDKGVEELNALGIEPGYGSIIIRIGAFNEKTGKLEQGEVCELCNIGYVLVGAYGYKAVYRKSESKLYDMFRELTGIKDVDPFWEKSDDVFNKPHKKDYILNHWRKIIQKWK